MIRYTNAPEVYDYEGTVISSAPQPFRFNRGGGMSPNNPFRLVTLDDADGGYYAAYQCDRYGSGSYLVLTPEQWADWTTNGLLVSTDDDDG